jgi:hypothetical protein
VLCVRTGYYGFALDVERLRLTHFGAINDVTPAEQAVAEDNATVMNLPAAALDVSVELGGVKYRLVGVDLHPKDALDFPVRWIESGRWLQRFDCQRLVFENDKKERLDADARLEVVAWPDVVSFTVELSPRSDLGNRELRLSSRCVGDGFTGSSTSSLSPARAGQTIRTTLVKSFGPAAGTARVEASRASGEPLPVELSGTAGWYKIALPNES